MIKQDDVHENHGPLPFPSNGPTIRAFVWLWWRAREGFGPRNIPGVCTVFQQLRLWGWGGAGSGQRFRRALEKIQKAERVPEKTQTSRLPLHTIWLLGMQ